VLVGRERKAAAAPPLGPRQSWIGASRLDQCDGHRQIGLVEGLRAQVRAEGCHTLPCAVRVSYHQCSLSMITHIEHLCSFEAERSSSGQAG